MTTKIMKKRYKGRKPGSKNRDRAFLRSKREELEAEMVRQAFAGNLQALKMALDRVSPRIRPQAAPVKVDAEASQTMADKAAAIVDSTLEGKIAPDVARDLLSALSDVARLREFVEFEERLRALEGGKKLLPWEQAPDEPKAGKLPLRRKPRRKT